MQCKERGIDSYYRYQQNVAMFAKKRLMLFNSTGSWIRISLFGFINQARVEFYRHVSQIRDCSSNSIIQIC